MRVEVAGKKRRRRKKERNDIRDMSSLRFGL